MVNWKPIEQAPRHDVLSYPPRVLLWIEDWGFTPGYTFDDGAGGVLARAESGGTGVVTHYAEINAPGEQA